MLSAMARPDTNREEDMTVDKLIALHDAKHVSLVRRGHWEYVTRPNVSGIVLIVPITDDGKLVLVEQFRIPVQARVIELVAGLAGDRPELAGEDLVVAARRELLEETGYEAERFELLTAGPPSAGITDEFVTLFKATGLRKRGKGGGDASEDITVHAVPLTEVREWLEARRRDGAMIDVKVYAGLYFALVSS